MDRIDLENLQVTYDEIIQELKSQIAELTFELAVNKIAMKKVQEFITNSDANSHDHGKDSAKKPTGD